jgi:hypothetical protein
MKCPHCTVGYSYQPTRHVVAVVDKNQLVLEVSNCTECHRPVLKLIRGDVIGAGSEIVTIANQVFNRFVYPKGSNRQAPKEVPRGLAEDFGEAVDVLDVSPKASAALSRRCLQNTIRDILGTKKARLVDEINDLISQNLVSSSVADQLHAVRSIGNFGAHEEKDTSTGTIIDVEPEEASYNLDVLEVLFDEVYVKPARAAAQKAAINAKLKAAGKNPI